MWPGWLGSPSRAWAASSGPARLSSSGSTLVAPLGRCTTTNTVAGSPAGRPRTTSRSTSTPPAEAPITITSCPAMTSPPVGRLARPVSLRAPQLLQRLLDGVDVEQHQRGAVDLVIQRHVGADAQRIPVAVLVLYLALVRGQRV